MQLSWTRVREATSPELLAFGAVKNAMRVVCILLVSGVVVFPCVDRPPSPEQVAQAKAIQMQQQALASAAGSYFEGRVWLAPDAGASRDHPTSLGGVPITVSNEKYAVQRITAADGSFEVLGLPEGWYKVSPDLPGFRPDGRSLWEAWIFNAGYTQQNFTVERYGVAEQLRSWLASLTNYAEAVLDLVRTGSLRQ